MWIFCTPGVFGVRSCHLTFSYPSNNFVRPSSLSIFSSAQDISTKIPLGVGLSSSVIFSEVEFGLDISGYFGRIVIGITEMQSPGGSFQHQNDNYRSVLFGYRLWSGCLPGPSRFPRGIPASTPGVIARRHGPRGNLPSSNSQSEIDNRQAAQLFGIIFP